MRYLSVCSGVEAASLAWEPLGWYPWAFSEIDPAPCAVLAHRWPQVPNLGDMARYQEWPDAAIDVLVGGTPCQSFSVAGLRKGLADPRGNLMLTFGAIAGRYRPAWLVWENVPGVLSSGGGRDFGAFLGMLAELGYGFAYRVLDAQHFGVPQRRRRVFVVGHLGDWRRAGAVLFECHSLSGHPAPSRETGEDAARSVAPCLTSNYGKQPDNSDTNGGPMLIPSTGPVSHSLNAGGMGRLDYESETMVVHTLRGEGFDAGEDGTGLDGVPPVRTTDTVAVAFAIQERAMCENPAAGPDGAGFRADGAAYTLEARSTPQAVVRGTAVRRLTPRECERLQGMPDDHTLVPYRGKPMADGPRYRMIGNSMAVPVMRWIGERIATVADVSAGSYAA